jgi:hypothetical protein
MADKDVPTDVVQQLFDRVEKEGVACATVADGHVLVFKESALERLLQDAKKNLKGQVVVFVRRPPKESNV